MVVMIGLSDAEVKTVLDSIEGSRDESQSDADALAMYVGLLVKTHIVKLQKRLDKQAAEIQARVI